MSLIQPPATTAPLATPAAAPVPLAAKTPAVIVPTPGRILWFWPSKAYKAEKGAQPCAAICTYVHGDRMVNISAYNCNGEQHPLTSVPLRQPEDLEPASGPFVEWMPYQVGQAKAAGA